MSELDIKLGSDTNTFAPGQTIGGTFSWLLDEQPEKLTLALHWFTKSRAERESGMADCLEFEDPGRSGSHDFSFAIPHGPYSFKGLLLSIEWTLELAAVPGIDLVRQPITISPTGQPVNP
jgi:hypothetical protein